MIVDTVDRARALVPDARIRILTGGHLVAPFRAALGDLPPDAYLVEPEARGTCPVLVWAAWSIARTDPDAVLVSLHSDHLVRPLDAFQASVRAAARIARSRDLLVTLGVEPDRIEPGFGHIQLGTPLVDGGTQGAPAAFRVAAFHEKPDIETARRYVEAGYLWNSGIFVWKASTFLGEVSRTAPDVAACLPLLESEGPEAFFAAVPSCAVDNAVLERSDRVACVRATFTWDDVGSWEALARTRKGDEQGNVVVGPGRVVDGSRNIVFSDGEAVVLFGVEDLIVVRSGSETLVLPRSRAGDLKALLSELDP